MSPEIIEEERVWCKVLEKQIKGSRINVLVHGNVQLMLGFSL